jgi:hypothetical protein
MGLSGLAMLAASLGWLTPVAGALTQEAIDVAVILNALRALGPGRTAARGKLEPSMMRTLHGDHEEVQAALDRLREIADALDDATPEAAVALIREAHGLVANIIVEHERDDEARVYPEVAQMLKDGHGLSAMSRAHREILHLARLLERVATGLTPADVDRYLARDAQRVIESIESLVRLHNAQEEDIYEHLSAR